MSRIGIIGDIHGNKTALRAVLDHADECDCWWCVGDVVGYGPDPNQCVEIVTSLGASIVAGNHDLGSVGKISISSFNQDARKACEWTSGILSEQNRTVIEALLKELTPAPGVLLTHGGPIDPVWNYISSRDDAQMNFMSFDQKLCFHGHSHVPMVFRVKEGEMREKSTADIGYLSPVYGEPIQVQEDSRYLINVGSVGQPRDNDPRSCYVIYDSDERIFTYNRVDYDIDEVQERMAFVGLPEFLIARLAVGR